MKVYAGDEREKHHASTFPIVEAELTDALIDELEMRAALERFGKRLAKQYADRYIGVEIHNVGVTFIPKPREDGRL